MRRRAPLARRQLQLGGGQALVTPFGTFHAPNISPDPDHGIGRWTDVDFVNAMKFGVAPGGVHLYPAFPYTSYQQHAHRGPSRPQGVPRHAAAGGDRRRCRTRYPSR